MQQSFTLLRLVERTKQEADASNDVSVSYDMPIVQVLEAGTTFEICQETQQKIETEVMLLKSLKNRRINIITKDKRNVSKEEKIYKLEEQIVKENNIFTKNLYLSPGSYSFWKSIENRIENLQGHYLIIPSYHKAI